MGAVATLRSRVTAAATTPVRSGPYDAIRSSQCWSHCWLSGSHPVSATLLMSGDASKLDVMCASALHVEHSACPQSTWQEWWPLRLAYSAMLQHYHDGRTKFSQGKLVGAAATTAGRRPAVTAGRPAVDTTSAAAADTAGPQGATVVAPKAVVTVDRRAAGTAVGREEGTVPRGAGMADPRVTATTTA